MVNHSVEWSSDEKPRGHRRTASAMADLGQPTRSTRKLPSVSGFLSSWPKNGVRKWKAMDSIQESDTSALCSSEMTRGINSCYEKSKSCLDCGDECYDKQLNGWYGVIQRQVQRSKYQMQHNQPVKMVMCIALLL